jgi:hypothetical protein
MTGSLGADFGNLDDDDPDQLDQTGDQGDKPSEDKPDEELPDEEKLDADTADPDPEPERETPDDDTEKPSNALDHRRSTKEPLQPFTLDPEIEAKLDLLSQMGADFDYEKMLRIALEPITIRNPASWTMQLPQVMKDLMTVITKTTSIFYPGVSNAQVQRCMVIVILRHLDEMMILAREAERKQQEQP